MVLYLQIQLGAKCVHQNFVKKIWIAACCLDEEHSLHTCSSHRPQGCKRVLCILYHFQLYSNPEIWIKCCSLHKGRKKGGGRGWISCTTQKAEFLRYSFWDKARRGTFSRKTLSGWEKRKDLGNSVCFHSGSSYLKKAIKHKHWTQIPAKFHYIWFNFQSSVQTYIYTR